jgi:hypothetical protein
LNVFAIIVNSYLFSYKLAIYHWKGFMESYNFVVESISIKTLLLPRGTWLLLYTT